MALYAAVECCFDQLPEAATLTVRTSLQGGRPSLEFVTEMGGEATPPFATGAASWGQMTELLDRIGASIETSDTERRLLIALPSTEVG
jgi:hypothetical protein